MSSEGKSIDDFVPEETIDSGFLDVNDKIEVKKTKVTSDASEDSDRYV